MDANIKMTTNNALSITVDDGMQEWKEIRIADGNEGWVETKQIEKI